MSFVPTDIAGLTIWLKADAIAGLNDGDAVATWADSSGNGNNATQVVAGNRPIYERNILNRKPVVRFTAANAHTMAFAVGPANQANLTIFWVGKHTSATAYSWVLGCSGGTGGLLLYRLTNAQTVTMTGGISRRYSNTSTTNHYETWRYTGGAPSVEAWDNGVSQTVTGAGVLPAKIGATAGTWGLGGVLTAYFDGDLAELLIYYGALTDPERESVETYLYNRWFVYPTLDCETLTDGKIDSLYNGTSLNTRIKTALDTLYSVTSNDNTTILRRYVNDVYKGDQ